MAMPPVYRKTTPRVKGGSVQKKNRHTHACLYHPAPPVPAFERWKPGPGYRHILRKRDIVKFINILPDWDELSKGLHAIVLARGDRTKFGYYYPNVVYVCAWTNDPWQHVLEADRDLLTWLGVPLASCTCCSDGTVGRFNDDTIRAFQLLAVLVHELGHHHDMMTTRSHMKCPRGEPFAMAYEKRWQTRIRDRYLEVFGLPRQY